MTRVSKGYFPNQKHSDGLSSAYYASLFIRDVHTGIMPYPRRNNPSIEIKLARANANTESKVKDFLYVGHYSAWSLSDSISDSIENLAHYLASFGDVYLEIVDDDSSDNTSGKTLDFIPRSKILRLFNHYIQIAPLSDWKGQKKFYVIPAEKVWHLKLPRKLGTPRSHRRLLNRLKHLSDPTPKFTFEDGDLGGSAKYEFTTHHDKKELAVEQITAPWGSIPSLRQINHTTEYYYVIHSLRFSYSKALLREHILNEMNALLKKQGIKNSIKISGLSLADDINNSIEKLEKGEVSFDEALESARN